MKSKIVAIVDATRAPGRGLVRAILKDKQSGFVPRAITHDVASEEARILVAAGVEVVAADIDDEASLRRAFEGAYGAFYLLVPSERPVPARPQPHAEPMARAAKHASLKHVIWGMLEDTRAPGGPDDDITPAFADDARAVEPDTRADSSRSFAALGVPTTFLQTWWHSSIPTGPLAEEIGRCAYGIFLSHELVGKTVSISQDLLAAETASSASGPVKAPSSATRKVVAVTVALAAVLLLGGILLANYVGSSVRVTTRLRATAPARNEGVSDPVIMPSPQEEPPPLEEPAQIEPQGAPSERVRRPPPQSSRARQRRGRPEPRESVTPARTPAPSPSPEPPRSASVAAPQTREHQRVEAPPPPPAALAARSVTPAPAPAPIENARPDGFIDPRAVTAIVRAHATEVRTCFDRALMERPELRGRLIVGATIDPSGHVTSVSPTRTLEGGARLQACVLTAFQGWTFPPPAGGVKGAITYAFSFE